jgi:hypothetical protein
MLQGHRLAIGWHAELDGLVCSSRSELLRKEENFSTLLVIRSAS